ncbi:MAG: SelT/SelW/SelH family protein [Calditrichaeota bacterium]|nr:SelT/SelW/SelH family protein [Calditrichota bacterium]
MAEEIAQHFGIEAELVQSTGGVFEVEVDGQLVFSKRQLGRFPEQGEVVRLLRTAMQ